MRSFHGICSFRHGGHPPTHDRMLA
jgi:hypothetical protein